jgi:cobalt-zinc-cadmium efflux system protein
LPHHLHFQDTGRVLKWSIAVTVFFVGVEIIAGVRAHSLALLSDAGHNFTDALALLLAWFGFVLQKKPADEQKTYGYHRVGVLTAFINALSLLGLSGWIFYESYHRFLDPRRVDEETMLVVAVLGLLVNTGVMLGLKSGQEHDLNIRSAFVHMLGDALGSAGIIAGAVTIHYTGWQRVDPVLSMVIGALIIWTAWDIILETLNVLLEGLPKGLDLQTVAASMRAVEGVCDVHDLHIWTLGSWKHALSCHVVIDDKPPSESEVILQRLNELLSGRFHIEHTTIQFEHVKCAVSENGCSLTGGPPRFKSSSPY